MLWRVWQFLIWRIDCVVKNKIFQGVPFSYILFVYQFDKKQKHKTDISSGQTLK